MRHAAKFALVTLLLAACGVSSLAQEGSSTTAAPEETPSEERRAPGSAPKSIRFGSPVMPGWNLAFRGSVLEVFDSNPAASTSPVSDTGERYTGTLSLSRRTSRINYLLNYTPSFNYYHRNQHLNSMSHTVDQDLRYRLSQHSSFAWSVAAQTYPAWAGTLFGDTGIGAMLASLTGLSNRDVTYDISSAHTQFKLEHAISRQTSVNFSVAGGVTSYHTRNADALMALLARPDSKTWSGGESIEYQHRFNAQSSIGFDLTHSYFSFTTGPTHENVGAFLVRYSRQFHSRWNFSVGLGPGLSKRQADRSPITSVVVRADASHTSSHSVLRFSIDHSRQPGLEPGSLTSWTGRVSYERVLSRRWGAGIYANYQNSRTAIAITTGHFPTSEAYALAAQMDYRLQRWLRWILSYSYSLQHSALTGDQRMGRNQIITGFTVQLDRVVR